LQWFGRFEGDHVRAITGSDKLRDAQHRKDGLIQEFFPKVN